MFHQRTLAAVAGLSHNLPAAVGGQNAANSSPHEFVIVGNHNPKLLFRPRHKLARPRSRSSFSVDSTAGSDFCSLVLSDYVIMSDILYCSFALFNVFVVSSAETGRLLRSFTYVVYGIVRIPFSLPFRNLWLTPVVKGSLGTRRSRRFAFLDSSSALPAAER